MSIYIEDVPRSWEQEFVYSQRNLKLDFNVIKKAIDEIVLKLNECYELEKMTPKASYDNYCLWINYDYYIKFITNGDTNLKIKLYNKHNEEYTNYINVEIKKYLYTIQYVNSDKKSRAKYKMDIAEWRQIIGEILYINPIK